MERKGLRSARVRAVLVLATLTIGALFTVPASALNPGEVAFADPNDDGYVNSAEFSGLDTVPHSVPVHWVSPGAAYDDPADTVTGTFVDDSNSVPAGCGPFPLTPSTSTSGTGWLNSTCAGSFADGSTIHWVVVWDDVDGATADASAEDTIVKDIAGPLASITLAAGADNKVTFAEANAGVPVSWNVGDTGPLVTVSAANDGQPAPAACTWDGQQRAATGGITPACFAELAEGAIDVFVTGADVAGNATTASDPNTDLTIDRVGDLADPVVQILNAPVNASNVGAVQVKITGINDKPWDIVVDDTGAPGTSPVTAGGTFPATGTASATVSMDLSLLNDGAITATGRQFDLEGNPSIDTALTSKDIVVPGAPLIASPANGSLNDADALKAAGSSERNATIEIWVDKGTEPPVRAVTGTADANGQWALTLPTRTAHLGFGRSGTYRIYARALDALGNPSASSALKTFDLDIDLPLVAIDGPANQTVFDNDDPVIVSGTASDTNDQGFAKVFAVEIDVFSPLTPSSNSPSVPTAQELSALAAACSSANAATCTAKLTEPIYRHEIAIGKSVFKRNAICKGTDPAETPCGLTGPHDAVWSYDLSFLPPGPYTVQVRSIDLAGNWSAQLAEVNFTKL